MLQKVQDGIVKVGIINVTGYAGIELVRLLLGHPNAEICAVTGRSQAGMRLNEVFPQIDYDIPITAELSGGEDVVFSAMPAEVNTAYLPQLAEEGKKVIDISADFRLNDASLYEKWYGFKHAAPAYLDQAVYGLPEINRDKIKNANLVANPGCYPTSVLLALAPALKNKLVDGDIIADCKSGVSGSGRSLSLKSHFCEINESVLPYNTAAHRHQPEIAQECAKLLGQKVRLTFSPHLVPMTRGICASCYAPLKKDISQDEVSALYKEFYKNEPFVCVLDSPPATKYCYGSNKAFVSVTVDRENGRLIAFGAIDNLVKGAAGQAIQNMNIMCGFPEEAGLQVLPVFP